MGSEELWEGTFVLHVDYEASRTPGRFGDFVNRELDHWERVNSFIFSGPRTSIPDYFLFVTNASLGNQERDEVKGTLARLVLSNFARGALFLDGRDIINLLEGNSDVALAFNGLTASHSPFDNMPTATVRLSNGFGESLLEEMRVRFDQEKFIRLSQSGGSATDRPRLDEIAIDLPLEAPARGKALNWIVTHSDGILKPSMTPEAARHLLLIGGPGQGKTTITQMLAEIFRTQLLDQDLVARSLKAPTELMAKAFEAQGVPRPNNRRWPIRVDLGKFAERIDAGESLLEYLAGHINSTIVGDVSASDLKTWFTAWPSVIILDGLDEVASPALRDRVLSILFGFLTIMEYEDADVLVVMSSRPQVLTTLSVGSRFLELRLRNLDIAEAVDYASQLAALRHRKQDPEFAKEIEMRIARSAGQSATARLMTTPLQVTIIYLLLEREASLPDTRHSLFSSYFDTIYARETAKPGSLARLLREYRSIIVTIHELVGLELQVAESNGVNRLLAGRLEEIASRLLGPDGEGFTTEDATDMSRELVRASTERLVLLTPVLDGVGFEIRSLQEYMASRAITSGPDNAVCDRLVKIAPYATWRNVWLLAAGRIFSERQHLRPRVVAEIRQTDVQSPFGIEGPKLALEMIEDGIALRAPIFQRQIFGYALDLLKQSPTGMEPDFARGCLSVWSDPLLQALIVSELELGLRSAPDREATTLIVLGLLSDSVGALPTKARQILDRHGVSATQKVALASWQGAMVGQEGAKQRKLGFVFGVALKRVGGKALAAGSLHSWLGELNGTSLEAYPPPKYRFLAIAHRYVTPPRLPAHLLDEDAAILLLFALTEMAPEGWVATALVLQSIRESTVSSPADLQLSDFA